MQNVHIREIQHAGITMITMPVAVAEAVAKAVAEAEAAVGMRNCCL